jgi:HEAT repeat protein
VPLVAENLSHPEPIVRTEAAATLDALGDAATIAVSELMRALEDRQGSVRTRAALALGKMTSRAEEIIPALLPVLGERNVQVANAAAWSLGQFGQQAVEAGPALVRLLRRGIVYCELGTLEDILDAILSVSSHPEELIMECLLEKDAETCRRALDLLKERQIDMAASKAETP